MRKVLPPPYRQEDLETIRYDPLGVTKYATGEGSAFKTLEVIGGVPPTDIENLDLGWARINIRRIGGEEVEIEYVHDVESNVGERHETVGMGEGQIPIEAWDEAKARGVEFEDFVRDYRGSYVGEALRLPPVSAEVEREALAEEPLEEVGEVVVEEEPIEEVSEVVEVEPIEEEPEPVGLGLAGRVSLFDEEVSIPFHEEVSIPFYDKPLEAEEVRVPFYDKPLEAKAEPEVEVSEVAVEEEPEPTPLSEKEIGEGEEEITEGVSEKRVEEAPAVEEAPIEEVGEGEISEEIKPEGEELPTDSRALARAELESHKYTYDRMNEPKHILGRLRAILNDMTIKEFAEEPHEAMSILTEEFDRINPPEAWREDFSKLAYAFEQVYGKPKEESIAGEGSIDLDMIGTESSRGERRIRKSRNVKDWWDNSYYGTPKPRRTAVITDRTYLGHRVLPPQIGGEL